MKVTRVIAVGIILSSFALSALNAQTLRNSQPPAEFPPASYKGKQYVDSRGCIYIRAGIDGNVTWVPRVSRSRKQICGYKPTVVAGSKPAPPPKASPPPVIITAEPPAAVQPAKPPAAPRVATRPKPAATPAPRRATTIAPTAQPRPVATTGAVRPKPATTKTRVRPKPTPPPAATTATAPAAVVPKREAQQPNCPNAPAASQPYINKPGGRFAVRCGPQAEPPVTYKPSRQESSVEGLPPDTRVVPRHVLENRRNTTNVSVPAGYKAAWDDDRLNPYRAERTMRPAQVKGIVTVPTGYKLVDWGDNRLNLRRGAGTPAGEAQASQIWSNTVPRKLITVRTGLPNELVPVNNTRAQVAQAGSVTRLSTRSAPATGKKGRYVRVAIYAGEAEARATAQALAGTGLPTRLGAVKSGNQSVVLAGPFTSGAQARAALKQLRGAGYLEARLGR